MLAVDAMDGDHAPDEIVAGALAARREHGIRILLTGPAARLRPSLTRAGVDPQADELGIVPAEDNLARGEIIEKITQRLGPGRSLGRGGHFLRRS